MKFGEIKTAEALNVVLAHGIRTGNVDLKKGVRLTAQHLADLTKAGVPSVIGVQFEPGDVPEDAAATQLAAAIASADLGMRADPAFTGRVNLFATRDGVLQIDVARVGKLNRIDPAITIATLPAFATVRPGQMLATIKIIPFAAAQASLDQALKLLAGEPMLKIAAFTAKRVALIQTEQSKTAQKMLDKTARITAERVTSVGGRIIGEWRCAHDQQALAAQIAALPAHDLLLIAGATAITDADDVLPAAIVQAGGRIEHFGMPVDPGNLLLLAERDDKPVLGLPGCARSPKLNGFDWILARLAANLTVTADDIMALGVGGLLAEIPTRPQPRKPVRRAASPAPAKIAGVLLAAGQSRRMGAANKLLLEVAGKPMLRHAVDAAKAAGLSPLIIVTGHERERLEALLADEPVTYTHNPDYADGLSTSLRCGIRALPEGVGGALIGLGDMPGINSALMRAMIERFNAHDGACIIVPTVDGKRGNPVLWPARFFAEMAQIEGDVGARHLIGLHSDAVVELPVEDAGPLTDLDTPEALDRYRATLLEPAN